MKKILLFVPILFMSVQSTFAYYLDGHILAQKMAESEKLDNGDTSASAHDSAFSMGYVMGVHDSLKEYQLFCVNDTVTAGKLCSAVLHYLKSHPEKWDLPACFLIADALKEAYPCP